MAVELNIDELPSHLADCANVTLTELDQAVREAEGARGWR